MFKDVIMYGANCYNKLNMIQPRVYSSSQFGYCLRPIIWPEITTGRGRRRWAYRKALKLGKCREFYRRAFLRWPHDCSAHCKQASKRTPLKRHEETEKMKWNERWINSMKWSWFKVPVKVKQIKEYLFSDIYMVPTRIYTSPQVTRFSIRQL